MTKREKQLNSAQIILLGICRQLGTRYLLSTNVIIA